MGYLKTKGIVIKEVNTDEADKIITIFSGDAGKISGFAKGAKRPKSRFLASSQFLCYSDFVLYKGKDMYSIANSDVIEPFYHIRNDVIKLTYAAHIADLVYDGIQENQPATKVLQLFLNSLHMLAKTEKTPELIIRIFELRFVSLMGYMPYVKGCCICGKEEFYDTSFSFKKCGFLCSECENEDPYAIRLTQGAAKAIHYILLAPLKDIFKFELTKDTLEELGRVSKRYLRERLEKEYTKLDFLKKFS